MLDVSQGLWHIALDEESSFMTTFYTPFGRYRWKRMPFGISSAPEVFQRRMHEGLQGIEVVADDFLVVGCGGSEKEAILNHDNNLTTFLQRCTERGIRLNTDKIKLRLSAVPFIGHIATDKGICADPTKIKAIVEMPPPTDVAGVQRLLGMVQYLHTFLPALADMTKHVAGVQRLLGMVQYLHTFLPALADMTKPLRELTQKNTEWVWDQPQQDTFEALKQAVASTPVLRYYSLDDEVTLQCDASQHGLGAALLQDGQPVAYASRALTSAETRYAQIEKELLAIVFACNRFEPYVYGCGGVNVDTDHQPLEMIAHKPLNAAPKRLQRMLLQLQKFSLTIRYKKGKQMYLADTLSRAHPPEAEEDDIALEVAGVDHTTTVALPPEHLQQIKQASADDPVLAQLRRVIQEGWPKHKGEVGEALHAYFDFRDELTAQDQLAIATSGILLVPGQRVHYTLTGVWLRRYARHARGSVCPRRDDPWLPPMTVEHIRQ